MNLHVGPGNETVTKLVVSLLPVLFTTVDAVDPRVSAPVRFRGRLGRHGTRIVRHVGSIHATRHTFETRCRHCTRSFSRLREFLRTGPARLEYSVRRLHCVPGSSGRFVLRAKFAGASSGHANPFVRIHTPCGLFLSAVGCQRRVVGLVSRRMGIFSHCPNVGFNSASRTSGSVNG